jgi:PEP-CTERM motif
MLSMLTKSNARLTLLCATASLACLGVADAAHASRPQPPPPALDPATSQTDVTGTLFGIHAQVATPAGGIGSQGSAIFSDADYGPLGAGVGASNGTATSSLGNSGTAPFVSAGVNVLSNGASSPTANAAVFYAFEVLGKSGTTAGIDVSAFGSVSATSGYDDGNAAALFSVYDQIGGLNHYLINDEASVACTETDLSGPGTCTFAQGTFRENGEILVPTNAVIFVSAIASAVGSGFPGSPYGNFGDGPPSFQETFLASVDPMFTLDPGDQEGLSLEFSKGIEQPAVVPGGGAGGVPEPAAWALMVGGFGLAGAALRSRRRTAAT